METILIHLVKSTSLALLFLISYLALLRKETFYRSNRFYLILGLVLSALLPLFKITKTIWVEPVPITYGDFAMVETTITPADKPIHWNAIIVGVYLIGVGFFTVRLLLQLLGIERLKQRSNVVFENDIKHFRSKKHLSPFSFFKNIFYCPAQYDQEELNAIIIHEKVHAQQYHSFDVLFTQVISILFWFNPLVWAYQYFIKQNLEFLADTTAVQQVSDKKQYQYLMLKQAVGEQQLSITNPFYNSLIKKRIVMLNQKPSKSASMLKSLIVLPLLVLFLVSFNSREVVKFKENSLPHTTMDNATPEFISPLHEKDIKEVSSGFGPARNPFSKEMDFHNGIDLVALSGKPVLASAEGIVKTSSATDKNGNFIVIDHADGFSTKYLHLKNRSVKAGERVASGTTIGLVGNTGKSTGPHLHFEILESGKPVNPASFIPFKSNRKGVKSIAVPKKQDANTDKRFELIIDKNTTNERLEKIKSDLAKDDIDFSYTTVRNDHREIIDISIQVSGKGENGASFNNSHNTSDTNNGISPLVLFIDLENNLVSIGTKGAYNPLATKIKKGDGKVWISSEDNNGISVWSGLDEIGEHGDIIIKKSNGEHKILINGEEVDEDELHNSHTNIFIEEDGDGSGNNFSFRIANDNDGEKEKKVKVKKHKSKKGKKTMIIKDSDEDTDIGILMDDDFSLIDFEGKDPLYIIDGKEASKTAIKKLTSKEILTIDVSKGEGAIQKYGEKAKNGVVEISTKNKK